MIRVKEAILVEGRYDKNALKQVVDALIVESGGFGIFKDREKREYLRRLGKERGLIVLTDSDGAGFVIRNHLKGILPQEQVKHAYIPDVRGKERRKKEPGKEGKLGVEGMRPEVLLRALKRAGATFLDGDSAPAEAGKTPVTKADLVRLGLSGGAESGARRKKLQQRLNLPERMTANGLLEALNAFYSLEQLEEILAEIVEGPGK